MINYLDYVFNIFGYIGGITLSFCLLPQLYKTIRTKSAKDISYGWQLMYGTGIGLLVIYAYYFKLNAMLIPGIGELVMNLILLNLKMFYDKNSTHSLLTSEVIEEE